MAAFRHKLDFPCMRNFAEDLENLGVLSLWSQRARKRCRLKS
jgi:hypothetical protein